MDTDLLLHIAPMTTETVPAVAALERECFSAPWSLDSLAAELSNPTAVFYTAELAGQVVGYGGMHHIIDEGCITNIAVAPTMRRKGIARRIMEAFLAYREAKNLISITLEVRPSNQSAIGLYQSLGFQEVGRRKNYYTSPAEDALILTRQA